MADPVHSKSSYEDDIIWDEYSDSKNVVSKKKPRTETDSYLVTHVTSSNLNLDRMCLSKVFSRSNGLNKRHCEIDLMNQHGESWTLRLRYNNTTGQASISGGWRYFCLSNGLEAESFYKFKLVRNGTRPLLQLCSDTTLEGNCSKAKRSSEYSESASRKQNNFLTLTLKPYMVNSGQLRLPGSFARESGINKAGEITLMDKNGVKWPSNLVSIEQGSRFYMAKGWRSFCAANELKEGETFTLEFIRGQSTTTPMLKFCSKAKVKIEEALFDDSGEACKASGGEEEEMETRVQKRARVFAEGRPSRRTLGSKSADLQHKQPIQPCSISDQVTKVKQSIMDVLTCVRRFRSTLEIKEQNLEASLLDIDVLGKKVLEINKILK